MLVVSSSVGIGEEMTGVNKAAYEGKRRARAKLIESELSREEDKWMDAVNDLTARQMVEWLKAGTDVRKPIDSLNKAQLIALAEIARATYIVEESKRPRLDGEIAADQAEFWA